MSATLRTAYRLVVLVVALHGGAASAQDGARMKPAPSALPAPAARTAPSAIPNPYAPAAAPANAATDAYATGFAIGLGSALISKQLEEERRRQQK